MISLRKSWPLIIVGGGPAAALQIRRLCASGMAVSDILLVSDSWGAPGMAFLGSSRLQSYGNELNLDDIPVSAAISAGFLQPTGTEYQRYVQDVLDRSGATRCQGQVLDLHRAGDDFALTVHTAAGVRRLETPCLVLATGTRPKRPPAAWEALGAHTYDQVYRDVQMGRTEQYEGRSVHVVGSGNSALQTAALLASVAATTVLAKKYVGMYPSETDDRFAWRAASQLTWELVVKSGRDRMDCDGTGTCVRFLVYDTLDIADDRLRISFRTAANGHQMGRHSTPDVHRHVPVRRQDGGWAEERPLERSVIVWATGCEPVYPAGRLIDSLAKDEHGYLRSGPRGETDVPRMFVTGSCAGRRAVNEMVPAEPVSDLLAQRAGR